MSVAKHTPGPWLCGDRFVYALETIRLGTGREYQRNRFSCGIHGEGASKEELEANARLIAAAPDLLEALRPFANVAVYAECVDAMLATVRPHERDSLRAAFEDARAAIAKATGENHP